MKDEIDFNKNMEEVEHTTSMQMEILQVDKANLAVEFQVLKGGDKKMFMDHFKTIAEDKDIKKFQDSMGGQSEQPKQEEQKLEEKLEEIEIK